jgi:hypothetical protein
MISTSIFVSWAIIVYPFFSIKHSMKKSRFRLLLPIVDAKTWAMTLKWHDKTIYL